MLMCLAFPNTGDPILGNSCGGNLLDAYILTLPAKRNPLLGTVLDEIPPQYAFIHRQEGYLP
jgi:hypothetical protein